MNDHRPVQFSHVAPAGAVPFDVDCLESEAVTRLFQEATTHISGVKIEMISIGEGSCKTKMHAAATVGIHRHQPTILFFESLTREERIEAISHELGHLVLVYRFGLGLVGLRVPRHRSREEALRFFPMLTRNWSYLLGQIPNTIHHLILCDYLKERYGITSARHAHLLRLHFRNHEADISQDEELSYARGLAAFEYEKLLGPIGRVINPKSQSPYFWKAYHAAEECFGRYHHPWIPAPSDYRGNILRFLEKLRYPRGNFVFFPQEE